MFKISKLTDYAVIILNYLATQPATVCYSASQLAEAVYLAQPTVSKILKQLQQAGLLASSQGAQGGYRLNVSVDELSLLRIVQALEGEIAITNCCEQQPNCHLLSRCQLKANWQMISDRIKSVLAEVSLPDMIPRTNQSPNEVNRHG